MFTMTSRDGELKTCLDALGEWDVWYFHERGILLENPTGISFDEHVFLSAQFPFVLLSDRARKNLLNNVCPD